MLPNKMDTNTEGGHVPNTTTTTAPYVTFTCEAADLKIALDTVALIPPKGNDASYLFNVVTDGGTGGTCHIHHRDDKGGIRAHFRVENIEGEGAFTYPIASAGAFAFASGVVTIKARIENGVHIVTYTTNDGGRGERSTVDPGHLWPADHGVDKAGEEHQFPAAILRMALGLAQPFAAQDPDAGETFRTLQIYDKSTPDWAKGDGYLYASDEFQAIWFECAAFLGKGLRIHAAQVGRLRTFLADIEGDVTVKTGPNLSYAITADGNLLAWNRHHAPHSTFRYYGGDTISVVVPVEDALAKLRQTRAEVARGKTRAQMRLNLAGDLPPHILFEVKEGTSTFVGPPLRVRLADHSEARDFQLLVDIDRLTALFEGVKAPEVVLGIKPMPRQGTLREAALMRTIEEIRVDARGKVVVGDATTADAASTFCKITRFTGSIQ